MCVSTLYFTVFQGDASASNGNKDSLKFDGMADAEVERRLKVTTLLSMNMRLVLYISLNIDLVIFLVTVLAFRMQYQLLQLFLQ